eukprot:227104-Rhodomonas_salina.4
MPRPLLASEERGADRMMLTRSSLRAVCCDGRRRGRNDNERRDTAARQNKRRRCHGSSISGQASHCKRKGAASPEAVSKSVMSGSTSRSQPWPPICPAQSPPPPAALHQCQETRHHRRQICSTASINGGVPAKDGSHASIT